MTIRINIIVLLSMVLLLIGCGKKEEGTINESDAAIIQSGVFANFDPTNKDLPFPTDLLFADSTDGTINIPGLDESDKSDPQVALNALDGFSTSSPIVVTFSDAVDDTTVTLGTTVRIFKVQLSSAPLPGGAVIGVESELGVLDVAIQLSSDKKTLAIIPLKPFSSSSSYSVVITNGIMDLGTPSKAIYSDIAYQLAKTATPIVDGDGNSLVSILTDEKAQALEPLRQLTTIGEGTIAASASPILASSDIVLSFTFSTQSVGAVLSNIYTSVQSSSPTTGFNTTAIDLSLAGFSSDFYVGFIDVPYYLDEFSVSNPTGPITGHWEGVASSHLTALNPTPVVKNASLRVPVLVATPADASATLPVVIFQHGITGDRTNMLGIADTLTDAGFAVIAIDLPLHGVSASDPLSLRAATNALGVGERHFNVDYVTQDATTGAITAAVPDTVEDSSGRHFINLNSLLTLRDNLNQAVVDLFTLTKALGSMDYNGGSAGGNFDTNNVYFVGHSLGAIVGSVFLSYETNVKDAVLANPGGGLARLVEGSPTFGSEIEAGLAAEGVIKGTADYELFLTVAQTVVDSVDPINHADGSTVGRGVLLLEVTGDGGGKLSDQVIPNNLASAPLSGTDPMRVHMGSTQFDNTTVIAGTDQNAWVGFTDGDHSSLLDPSASANVTGEMQSQVTSFLLNNGDTVTIGGVSAAVIKAVP